jgi:plastocyanin
MALHVAFSLFVLVLVAFAGLAHAALYQVVASPESPDLKWFSLSYFPQSLTIQQGDSINFTCGVEPQSMTFPNIAATYDPFAGYDPTGQFQLLDYRFLLYPQSAYNNVTNTLTVTSTTATFSTGFLYPPFLTPFSWMIIAFPNVGNYTFFSVSHPFTGWINVIAGTAPQTPTQVQDATTSLISSVFSNTTALLIANNLNTTQGVNLGTNALGHTNWLVTAGWVDPSSVYFLSYDRFIPANISIHTKDSVTWSNTKPLHIHGMAMNSSGVINSPEPTFLPPFTLAFPAIYLNQTPTAIAQNYTSGFISAGLLLPNKLKNYTVFFLQPGTYYYICIFHYSLGMVGYVIVTDVAPALAASSALLALLLLFTLLF